MLEISNEKEVYTSDFEALFKDETAKGAEGLHSIRRAAQAHFSRLNFPTPREESWRFTNVAPLVKIPFHPAYAYALDGLSVWHLEPFLFDAPQWTRLVFVNGLFSKELSFFSPLSGRVRVRSLAEALATEAEEIRPYLARYAEYDNNAFTALNTAFLRDGALVQAPDGATLTEPIHLVFLATERPAATVSYPRTLILMGRSSQATVIESYIGLSENASFLNAVSEIVVGEGAVLDHYKIQRQSACGFFIGATQVHQERRSFFSHFSLDLGSALARTHLNVRLNAEGGECALNGLYLLSGDQLADNHTLIDHVKPHGTSHEVYKGILSERSKAVFNGKIIVRKDAQQTDAHQLNKNLLLSDHALVNTTPQLEILADDVKCTHGATVGQLDEDSIFYFKSRGLDEETARRLLTYGFATDVINRIKSEPIRTSLHSLVRAQLDRPPAKEAL